MDAGFERPQKRMRKGTKSCAECRRRKIRCNYLPGFEDCSQCSVRGSKCTSQGLVVPDDDDEEEQASPVLVSTGPAVGESAPRKSTGIDDLDITTGLRPPLASMLDRGKTSSLEPNAAQKPSLCETFRSNLPVYDTVITALAKNGAWWESFRQKTRAVTQAGLIEPLLTFAAQAYTSSSPAKLGILVVAYGRCLVPEAEAHRLFRLVDDLAISDMAVASSLDGMECLVLLAKTYTDIGQPRRAWLTWRKGLAIAQLLGLHRSVSGPADRRQRIWMAIYHGDRFTSLLLGLPHGFSDSHLIDPPSTSETIPGSFEQWITKFIHDCAVVAGRVIESILLPAKPSFATAMQLDEKLEAAFNSAPPGWWDLPELAPGNTDNFLVEKLLIHFFFFHVRLYIHLPFLKSDTPSPSYSVSRAACTEAARSLLQRAIVLRARVNGIYLFDCKTSDFVGFTAAVVLLIGARGSGGQSMSLQDEQLLRQAESIFQELANGGCRIASQCHNALSLLSHPPQDKRLQEIVIPYFGIVSLAERPNMARQQQPSQTPKFASTVSSGATLTSTDYNEPYNTEYSVDYSGYQGQNDLLGGDWAGEELTGDHSMDFQVVDLASLDIDQDWALFLTTVDVE